MIRPDVNVLVHAFRPDSRHHGVCKPWLDRLILGDSHFGMSPLALSAMARIATNARIFREPDSLTETFAFCHHHWQQAVL